MARRLDVPFRKGAERGEAHRAPGRGAGGSLRTGCREERPWDPLEAKARRNEAAGPDPQYMFVMYVSQSRASQPGGAGRQPTLADAA